MKQFLKNFIAISLIIIVITAVLECLLLTRPNLYSYKSNYVKTHADEIEYLLLGNSHIEEALIPDSMGKGVFNMAISGRSLAYDVELAKMHVPSMHNLKVLLVPYDYYLFYLGRNPNKKSVGQKALESTIKCMNYKYMGLRVDGFWYWSEFLFSEENVLSRFFKSDKELIECDSLGFIPLDLSFRRTDWKQKALPADVDLSREKRPELYDKLYKNFVTLAEITKAYHVRLVLISIPMYNTYRKKMSKALLVEKASFATELHAKFPHIEYYDYTFDYRFDDDDFNDASHLSVIGASKFSKIVKEEILEKKPKTVL